MQFSKAPLPIVSVFVLFRSEHLDEYTQLCFPGFPWLVPTQYNAITDVQLLAHLQGCLYQHYVHGSHDWHHQSRYEYCMPEAVCPSMCSVASLIPMLKGVPRYGGGHWGGIKAFTPDAEITVGRIAMLVRSDCYLFSVVSVLHSQVVKECAS